MCDLYNFLCLYKHHLKHYYPGDYYTYWRVSNGYNKQTSSPIFPFSQEYQTSIHISAMQTYRFLV